MTIEFYIYARDEDHALELAGNGASKEFRSLLDAREGYDPEVDADRQIFRILVEAAETST